MGCQFLKVAGVSYISYKHLSRDYSETQIYQSKAKEQVKWTLLFKKLRFFPRYEHFIQVDVLSQDATEHNKWLKNVETKLQKLADAVYKQLGDNLQELRVLPRPFSRAET